MTTTEYYLGTQEIMSLDSQLVKNLSRADKDIFTKIMANADIASQSMSIQELDYLFIQKLHKEYPENGAIEKVFKRLRRENADTGYDGFNTDTDDESQKKKGGGMDEKEINDPQKFLKMKVKEAVAFLDDMHDKWDISNLKKELKDYNEHIKELKKQKASKVEIKEANEKAYKIAAKIMQNEIEVENLYLDFFDNIREYLKKFSLENGLLSIEDIERNDGEDFSELYSIFDMSITEPAYRESTWEEKLITVWIEIVTNYKSGEKISLNEDYSVPVEYSPEAAAVLPAALAPFVGFILRKNPESKLISAGFNTMPLEDILPAWTIVFTGDKILTQQDIITSFDCRVKVVIKDGNTYFILPYKIGPGDAQLAKMKLDYLETKLAENYFYQKNKEASLEYEDKLRWLKENIASLETTIHGATINEKIRYIDAHTSFTKEQLLAFFSRQPNGTIFKGLLFGKLAGWSRKDVTILKQGLYAIEIVTNKPKTHLAQGLITDLSAENIVDMIFDKELVVLTEKSPYIAADKKTKEPESEFTKELPKPVNITVEFDVPSEDWGITSCVVSDIGQAILRGGCSCGDGSDYRFTQYEIAQLKEILETGESQLFKPVSSLPEPLNWISRMDVDGNYLRLPKERMTGQQYASLKSVLLKAGGKYVKNSFVFEEPAMDVYLRVLSGEDYNLKKKYQFYPTPAATADYMISLAEISCEMKFLEPSAGRGAIINAIHRVCPNAQVDYCEIMDSNRKYLKEIPYTNYITDDFINIKSGKKYDRIIANPPFNKDQDENHIRLMYDLLAPQGRIVTVSSKHWQFAKDKHSAEFRDWVEKNKARVIDVPAGTFKESGTIIPTIILVIDKK